MRHKPLSSLKQVLQLVLVLTALCAGTRQAVQASGADAAAAAPVVSRGAVMKIDLHDTLQPERAAVFARQMRLAEQMQVRAVIVDLSTPGGLANSADEMVSTIQRSTVPVIVWSGWPNTRITGDGLRLLAAADLSLMHPASFLTPLWTEHARSYPAERRATESRRLDRDLTLALQQHGRGRAAVAELSYGAHWFTASEALQAGFVDGLARNPQDVLRLASGRAATRDGRTTTLDLSGAKILTAETQLQEKLMLALMNPDLAVLLLTLGLLMIYLEINTPGVVFPGAAGVLLVLLALYSLDMLPLSAWGISLCLLAALFLLLEARFSKHGLLALCGIVALAWGLGILVRGPVPQLQVEWSTAVGAALGFGGVTATLVVLGMEARRAKVKTGSEAMLGWLAVAQTPLSPAGHILVRGELWRARLTTSDSFVAAGERVKVLRADGTTLEVTAIPLSNAV